MQWAIAGLPSVLLRLEAELRSAGARGNRSNQGCRSQANKIEMENAAAALVQTRNVGCGKSGSIGNIGKITKKLSETPKPDGACGFLASGNLGRKLPS
jgi:hypothetical protein